PLQDVGCLLFISILIVRAFYFLLHISSNYTSSTKFYTLSLHDALPIYNNPALNHARMSQAHQLDCSCTLPGPRKGTGTIQLVSLDRKSTRLNSSHGSISYAVFCLKKKNTNNKHTKNN